MARLAKIGCANGANGASIHDLTENVAQIFPRDFHRSGSLTDIAGEMKQSGVSHGVSHGVSQQNPVGSCLLDPVFQHVWILLTNMINMLDSGL